MNIKINFYGLGSILYFIIGCIYLYIANVNSKYLYNKIERNILYDIYNHKNIFFYNIIRNIKGYDFLPHLLEKSQTQCSDNSVYVKSGIVVYGYKMDDYINFVLQTTNNYRNIQYIAECSSRVLNKELQSIQNAIYFEYEKMVIRLNNTLYCYYYGISLLIMSLYLYMNKGEKNAVVII